MILYGHKERQTDTNNEGVDGHIIHSFEVMNIGGGGIKWGTDIAYIYYITIKGGSLVGG